MQKHSIKVSLIISFSAICFFLGGLNFHHRTSTPLNEIQGVWNGQSELTTSTGQLKYDINALIQEKKIVLSLIAESENKSKFAFKLDLDYIEHSGNTVLFSVKERKTIWLEQLREKDTLDIPIMGHFLMASIALIDENKMYFSYSVGTEHAFGTLFEKGI
ncbi:hypothetical protein [Photobacterium nomapromontoriensis]|uniref:hypothetical protein n=1 Tax=Photobacterium nomapromontoriensis TaxID=2910237 RepID=UPI003D0FA6D2